MRVKIAYTVEMDEVEEEVVTIMQKALSDIETASSTAFDATSQLSSGEGDIVSIVEKIDSARLIISRADQIMSDCYEILKAYRQALQRLEEEVKNEQV